MTKLNKQRFTRPKQRFISSSQSAKLLLEPNRAKWLQPFITSPITLSQVTRELNISMSTYSYQLKKLLSHGLIFETHKIKRAGKPIRYYWSSAERFIIPLSVIAVEDYYQQYLDYYRQIFFESFDRILATDSESYYVEISYDKQKDLVYQLKLNNQKLSFWKQMLQANEPAILATLRDIQLSYEDAKDLQKDLYNLLAKYEEKANLATNHYQIQIFMAKMNE